MIKLCQVITECNVVTVGFISGEVSSLNTFGLQTGSFEIKSEVFWKSVVCNSQKSFEDSSYKVPAEILKE